MTEKRILDCPEFAARLGLECGCCGSCHVDADEFGYRLIELDLGDVEAWVCCRMAAAYEELKPEGSAA